MTDLNSTDAQLLQIVKTATPVRAQLVASCLEGTTATRPNSGQTQAQVKKKFGESAYSLNFLLGVACFWFWSSRMSARVS